MMNTMMNRSLNRSLLAAALLAVLFDGGDCSDRGLRGDSDGPNPEQSQRRINAHPEDELVLQAAKHSHGSHDCEVEVTFIAPDYKMRTGSQDDVRYWEQRLAATSHDDTGVFGSLEMKNVEVDWQAAVPVSMDENDPAHRALVEELLEEDYRRELRELGSENYDDEYQYWYKAYYERNFYWGFNKVYFWSNLGKCTDCKLEKDDWEGDSRTRTRTRTLRGEQLTRPDSAKFAKSLFEQFRADKTNAWMNNVVYLHAQGDCGPGLKIDALFRMSPPDDMPLLVDGVTPPPPKPQPSKNTPLIVDGAH
eukprot:CAMPEP_0194046912 /NCGR_PEP_ID=MMETSP0009_2-20130614/22941_1 /TAXON_ID=210454 /ORGANISM="Grammatophora oceanica, Strain CCMP 410" /LENGTH=305 /DNA_ID=CAMNT_0038692381 /DNA_START=44 /DNA_END=961 /DNA_ORIENTATION=+